jgi:hypothetical protein
MSVLIFVQDVHTSLKGLHNNVPTFLLDRIMLEGRCAAAPESCQGCASPYAFETALRLLEIEEEIVGARMTRSTSQGVGGRAQHCTRVSGWAGGVTALVWGHA